MSTIDNNLGNILNIINLFQGSESSDCLAPCTKTSTTTREVFKADKFNPEENMIKIILDRSVKTHKTSLVKFEISQALSFPGANMGLWLGLGVLQLLEIFYEKIMAALQRKNH